MKVVFSCESMRVLSMHVFDLFGIQDGGEYYVHMHLIIMAFVTPQIYAFSSDGKHQVVQYLSTS